MKEQVLIAIIKRLEKRLNNLEKENLSLKKENAFLKERLSKYENPKNSTNSSVPPSQDPNRKTKSLRKKSNKKVGGQKGHKGYKLHKSKNIDTVIFHNITECTCCKSTLPEKGDVKTRQLFDIPKIQIEVTEHRIITKICKNCGKKNKTNFPDGLVQEAQYGNNIKSLGVYLQNYHMIPYKRCSEMIFDLVGHKISEGSLANFQSKIYEQLSGFEQEIKKLLLQSPVLNVDETGVRLNGKLNWMHVASSSLLSHFGFHSKRGKQAIDSFNILPLYNGIITHDRFSSYFKYTCKHSLCNAHILRELFYLWETKEVKWAKDMSNLLVNVHHRKKQGKKFTAKNYDTILKRLEELVKPIIENYDKTYTKTKEEKLAFALEKHKHLFLRFIKVKEVSFDNNQAERDLRMIKVKQKVSGCFRQYDYGKYFARIRSYISTLKKNQQNILINFHKAFNDNCFLPILAE